jgi:putative glutamine amidotransferase
MLKTRRYFFTVCFILIIILISCTNHEYDQTEDRITIGLINPNVYALESFHALIENNILNIPDVTLMAVCYDQVERDIPALQRYIQDQVHPLYKLKVLSGTLTPENIFHANDLSSQFEEVFSMTDGLFFLGGADIPPEVYQDKTSLLSSISTPKRHLFELSFLFHLLGGYQDSSQVPLLEQNPSYKVIGFCLGMQTLNVATGGSMIQDIPSEVYGLQYVEDVLALETNKIHRNYWQDLNPQDDMISSNFHQIRTVKTHPFFDSDLLAAQEMPYVYSSHHQAVKQPGKNLEILATSRDGKIVEIIAHKVYRNVFAVQFHPEVAALYQENGKKMKWIPDDPHPRTYYDFLTEKHSLEFHKKFWRKINTLYTSP